MSKDAAEGFGGDLPWANDGGLDGDLLLILA
jgi:hypothetical protein